MTKFDKNKDPLWRKQSLYLSTSNIWRKEFIQVMASDQSLGFNSVHQGLGDDSLCEDLSGCWAVPRSCSVHLGAAFGGESRGIHEHRHRSHLLLHWEWAQTQTGSFTGISSIAAFYFWLSHFLSHIYIL